ncbi:hypothetical protein QTN25_006691 [Entamoeba marina]
MQLELPYLMNIWLYIQNNDIINIPFISKRCQDSCRAMKTNPWLNPNKNPKHDLDIIFQTFPRIETLRIDYKSLVETQKESCMKNILIIEIVGQNYTSNKEIDNEEIINKLKTTFNCNINKRTTKMVLNETDYTHDIFGLIKKHKRIKNVHFKYLIIPEEDEIQYLNEIGTSKKVVVDVLVEDVELLILLRQMLIKDVSIILRTIEPYIVVSYFESYEFCINPFNDQETMSLYEKYYLPLTLHIESLINDHYNFKTFKYATKIYFDDKYVKTPTQLTLPTTITHIDLNNSSKDAKKYFKIVNWKELNNVKSILDYENLDIPYPHIKYERCKNKVEQTRLCEKLRGWFSFMCGIYLLILTLMLLYSILFQPFDLDVLFTQVYNQVLIHVYLLASYYIILDLLAVADPSKQIKAFNYIMLIYSLSIIYYGITLQYYASTYWILLICLTNIPIQSLSYFLLSFGQFNISEYTLFKYIYITFKHLKLSNFITSIIFPIVKNYPIISTLSLVYWFFIHCIGLMIAIFFTPWLISCCCAFSLLVNIGCVFGMAHYS